MPVFDDFDREWDGPADATGSPFEWLNRSASPEASRARDEIERLYAQFPDTNGTLIRALQAPSAPDSENAFYGALGSLVIYDRLHGKAAGAIVDEDVQGHTRRPDLQLLDGDDEVFCTVEVTALCAKGVWAESDWYVAQLEDALNSGLRVSTCLIGIVPDGLWTAPPAVNDIVELVRARIAELPPPEVMAQEYEDSGAVYSAQFACPGCKGELEFIPVSSEADADDDGIDSRIVGMKLSAGGCPGVPARIRSKLVKKRAKRFPAALHTTDRPYVVALMNVDHYADLDDLVDALFGDVVVAFPKGGLPPVEGRNGEGFFFVRDEDGALVNTALSGVIFVDRFAQSHILEDHAVVYYVQNPAAANPVDPALFEADYVLTPDGDGKMTWKPELPGSA